jgi:hypothetical protein
MKNPALIFLSVLFAAGVAAGQEATAGFKVGPLLSFGGDEAFSSIYGPQDFIGLKIGLFYVRRISAVFSFQAEAYFAIKGVDSWDYHLGSDFGQLNYLELPVFLNVGTADGILEVFTGPYVAVLISHTPLEGHVWTSPYNELKTNDVGACLGLRVWLRNTSLELQLMSGFINILPHYRDPDLGHYNTTLALLIGYKLLGRSDGGARLHR